MPRRFRRLRECILEDLQLFGFDGGARSAPLGSSSAFVRRFRLGRVVTAALALSVPINRAYVIHMLLLKCPQEKEARRCFVPSESLPSLSSMVVDGVEGRWGLMTMPPMSLDDGGGGMISPCVIGVIGRLGDGIVKLLAPLLLSALTGQWWLWLLLLASFSIDSEIDRVSSSSSSDAEFSSSSRKIKHSLFRLWLPS